MPFVQTGNVGAPISIIGKDLDAGGTFNADVKVNTGVHKAGEIVKFVLANREFEKWVGGTDAAALIYGILAFGVDASHATIVQAGMCYRRGVFLRQEIESANNFEIDAGSPTDLALNGLGIFLEYSYEGYQGVDPTPAGVQVVG